MEYIINNRLIYNDNESYLVLQGDDEAPVILTATLNRLLALLVRNNGTTLPRDMLLQQVWEVYGQVASNHNLNNNISVLRKLLAGLGEENIIVTQPKIGFHFAATELQLIGGESVLANPTVEEKVKTGKPSSLFHRAIVAIITVLVGVQFWWSRSERELPISVQGKVELIGACRVQFINKFHDVARKAIDRENVQKSLAAAGIACNKPAQVYYYYNGAAVPHVGQPIIFDFISYCPQAAAGEKRIQCENIYANTHA